MAATFGLPSRDWRTSLSSPSPVPTQYGTNSKPASVSALARLAGFSARIFQLLLQGLGSVLKLYCRALRWALARPSRVQRCLVSSALVLLLALFGTVLLAQIFRYMANDPCAVARAAEQALVEDASRAERPLPKKIHQQWKTDRLPEGEFTAWNKEFKRLFPAPEFKHELWTDVRMRAFIAERYPWFLKAYDGYSVPVQRADAVRYFILYTYGGLYADLDYEPLVNFWDALPSTRPAFIESPYKYNENVQNSLMSSPAGHAFWNRTFDLLAERASQTAILTSTGPKFLDEAVRRAQANALGPETVYILPCENFHRIPVGEAGKLAPGLATLLRELMSRSFLVKQCGAVSDLKCQFGVHHNAVSWSSSSSMNTQASGWFSWW